VRYLELKLWGRIAMLDLLNLLKQSGQSVSGEPHPTWENREVEAAIAFAIAAKHQGLARWHAGAACLPW
jgi:hypothetical protein